ncbi:hypothetical protein [Methylorubrum thiocyanatum]|uniref:hypothetical protein n=1 Tax=Methylorubrum thiocyanatum TaxID=47958 RepID=UPI00364A2E9C
MVVIGGLAYWFERRLILSRRAEQPEKPVVAAWAMGMRQDCRSVTIKPETGKGLLDALLWFGLSLLFLGLSAFLLIVALPFLIFVCALFGVALAI